MPSWSRFSKWHDMGLHTTSTLITNLTVFTIPSVFTVTILAVVIALAVLTAPLSSPLTPSESPQSSPCGVAMALARSAHILGRHIADTVHLGRASSFGVYPVLSWASCN
ncbi:hypothetical protein L227DRAFT_73239 [Lentinus tigrinus ALCF2SS1-6]|uniref:Uncharacterized protein n=1 Tax=Lentinus tigrinus ALCF2SS1-6 TaxID=1328759 RepID=A0A5C2SCJ4_9APHY|nr:hypothetical protein L227DRAFT_73239 [Lentinus tigrinus ALCF2SS1-6]